MIDIDDDIIAVNPGSLSYPRQEGRQPSYAIMEIDRGERCILRLLIFASNASNFSLDR